MPLSPQEKQDMAELEELDKLDAKFGNTAPKAPAKQYSALESGLENAANIGGYAPQAAGAMSRVIDPLAQAMSPDVVDPKTGQPIPKEQMIPQRSYLDARDQEVRKLSDMSKQHPVASMAGNLAGNSLAAAATGGASAAPSISGAAATGAAIGGLYNPGDKEGVIDPTQLKERAVGAALGGVVGAGSVAAGKAIKYGAGRARDVDMVKDSANLSRNVKSEIDAALQGVNANEIEPRADQLQQFLQGKNVPVDVRKIQGADPVVDRYSQYISKKLPMQDNYVDLPAKSALRVRQKLDDAARYAQSKPFDTGSVAKGETAKVGADSLRSALGDLGPEVGELNSGMGQAIRLRDALARKAKSAPISAIKGAPGTDKGSLIDAIDKMGGSDLEGLSNRIDSAKDLLLNPSNLVKPLEAPNEMKKIGIRGISELARSLDNSPVSNALGKIPGKAALTQEQLMELIRRGRSNK